EIQERERKRAATRKSMVSTGDRSAKIRTYNYPQGRVTDHRIGLTLYRLTHVLEGDLDELINGLFNAEQAERLAASGSAATSGGSAYRCAPELRSGMVPRPRPPLPRGPRRSTAFANALPRRAAR